MYAQIIQASPDYSVPASQSGDTSTASLIADSRTPALGADADPWRFRISFGRSLPNGRLRCGVMILSLVSSPGEPV